MWTRARGTPVTGKSALGGTWKGKRMSDRPRIISPDTLRGGRRERTPPAQSLTTKWPVLHYGKVPGVDLRDENWSLRVFGLVENPYELKYDQIRALPAVDVVCDIHCVTHWSRLDNTFTG